MKILRNIILVSSIVVLVGCGGSSSPQAQGDITAPDDLGELTKTEQLLYSEAYSGYIVVFLNEAMGTRLSGQNRLISTKDYDSELANVQQVLDAHPTATIKRSVTTDPDKLDARRAELEELSGKELQDFNSIYHIYVNDPDEGVRLMRELGELGVVERVYPKQQLVAAALVDTPDLTPHQGYLQPESTHGGLNAVAAWNAGVRGEGAILVDGDSGWNRQHEDLNIDGPDFYLNGMICTDKSDPYCATSINHGTAMVGIMAAQDNNHGITGFAPNVDVYGATMTSGDVAGVLSMLTDGEGTTIDDELPPGTIFALIMQTVGANSPGVICTGTQTGCVPSEADPDSFAAVQYATAAGITVIAAAANGAQDLDDAATYFSWQVYLPTNDSGSVLVGASTGASKTVFSYSNYGSPVDTFAWGDGVATTAFPIPTEPNWDWLGTTPPVPPATMDDDAFFVDSASGTSPATAQVAGAAALIQSYAKQVSGQTTRYLMPAKLKEILIQSGVAQVGGGGNIGVQPRVDVAMGLVDSAWASWSAAYPELISGQDLSSGEVASLRQAGLGIICVNGDPAASDPTCPDDSLNVPGTGIAEDMDFDGDDRADLVQWKRGQFKIDLAAVAGDDDGFGAWDVVVNYPQINSDVVWPYVEDMDSDLRTDLVLYDKENGTWYIAYMNSAMLSGGGFGGWDHVITTNIADTREMDPSQSMYCRPHPDDYDNDGWIDLAVACSDGVWYMEYSPGLNWPSSITYVDNQFQYLSQSQLAVAPGWAYLTRSVNISDANSTFIFVKTPDGLPEEGRIKRYAAPNFSVDSFEGNVPYIFGGNDNVMFLGRFTSLSSYLSIGLKSSDGLWAVAEPNYDTLIAPQPEDIWGDISCHPITADFDGDGMDDRAVMCPDEWRISYSGEDYPQFKNNLPYFRAIDTLTYDSGEFTLPGRSYSGGVSYDTAQQIIEWYEIHYPGTPPPVPVDMVSVTACDFVSFSECN